MSAVARFPPTRPGQTWTARPGAARLTMLVVVVTVVASVGTDPARALVGALALTIFTAIAFSDRRAALLGAVIWVVMLGFTRRLLIPFAGWSTNDPLLLFSPAAALILLVAVRRDRPPSTTAIGSLAVFQLLWFLVSVFNPNEHNFIQALQGAMFFIVPILWLFVGRHLRSEEHDRMLSIIVWLLVPAVGLGLWQTFVGLLPFEYHWLSVAHVPPSLIFVNGFHVRSFSTFTSPQEYGVFLLLGATVLWARILYGEGRRGRQLVFLGVTIVAIFLQSSRGVFVALLAVLVILAALYRRSLVGVLFGVAFVVFAFSPLLTVGPPPNPALTAPQIVGPGQQPSAPPPPVTGGSTASALFNHELYGLLHPSQSTAGLHVDLVRQGFDAGLHHPLGLGPSQFSIVQQREQAAGQAPATEGSPESQLPTTMAAFGIPPALALLALYVVVAAGAYRLWRWQPSVRHLAWIGFLIAVGDQALNGRLYATSTIIGLVVGGISTEQRLSRMARHRRAPLRAA